MGIEATATSERELAHILCAKCKTENPASQDHCSHCHSHLYLACPSCGDRNSRSVSICGNCGVKLRSRRREADDSISSPYGTALFGRPGQPPRAAQLAVCAFIVIVFLAAIWLFLAHESQDQASALPRISSDVV